MTRGDVRWFAWGSGALLAALCAMLLPNACTSEKRPVRAFQIAQRADLIGGPRALGEVGDFMLENDQVRVIIQNTGFSRGFGVFGGSLIDADLVREEGGRGSSEGGLGRDNFGEMFPAFFLQALEPSDVINPQDPTNPAPDNRLKAIEVTHDGSDGTFAEVAVRGYGGDFLALTQQINQVLLSDDRENPKLLFTTRYRLRPGARHVEIETTVQNVSIPGVAITLPNELAGTAVPTPFGDVVLFGAGNQVFMPHEAGYDLRFRLEAQYADNRYTLPALPGITGEFIASSGPGVSYGILAVPPDDVERNYVWQNRDQYAGATPHSVHVPFIASAFTGVFQVMPPPLIAPNDRQPGGDDEFTFRRYFIVGAGDVASISDEVYTLLGDATGQLSGRLLDEQSLLGVEEARVVILDEREQQKVTAIDTGPGGRFGARLRPGSYVARLVKEGRNISAALPFVVRENEDTFVDWRLPPSARVRVTVVEPGVGPIPAKVTLVGTAPQEVAGRDTKEWLFDLSLGEHWRYTDLIPDSSDDETRRFIEAFGYTEDGVALLRARPGTYRLVVSRGPEYDRFESEVILEPGREPQLSVELHRVVDTTGYVGADFHLHSRFSLDSFHSPEDRLHSFAGEGLELVVSTDHNFVSDYAPVIGQLGLERFLNSAVGLELTTIDRGHFNGFPLQMGDGSLRRDASGVPSHTIASRTYGSFEWAGRTPQEIFDALRALGQKSVDADCQASGAAGCPERVEPVIVQVNHPRDSILGYFDQYVLEQDTLRARGQSGLIAPVVASHPEFSPEYFSWDFDAIEVFNGKRFETLRNFRVPTEGVPQVEGFGSVDPLSCCPLSPGEVVRELPSFDCDPAERDCTCTPADVRAQLDAGKCAGGGDILFPGAVDDWFQILKTGKRVIGTANSDSHEPESEEPGYPRTYIATGVEDPRWLRPADITRAFARGDALMTNGPFLRVHARGTGGTAGGMGSVVTGPRIELEVTLDSAPWVVVEGLRVWVDGALADERALDRSTGPRSETFTLEVSQDAFVVVEAFGSESLFPTVYPNEVPPIQFTDVVGAIGGSFGLGGEGGLAPELTFPTTPYALTNPLFVDGDGDGEVSPRIVVPELLASQPGAAREANAPLVRAPPVSRDEAVGDGAVPDGAAPAPGAKAPRERALPARKRLHLERALPPWLWPTDHPHDVRRVLVQFLRHTHG